MEQWETKIVGVKVWPVTILINGILLLISKPFVFILSGSDNNPVLMVPNQTTDFHLSKEESGIQLIIQDSNSSDELHLGKWHHSLINKIV